MGNTKIQVVRVISRHPLFKLFEKLKNHENILQKPNQKMKKAE